MDTAPETIDAYFAGLRPEERETLDGLRRSIKAIVPEAGESISYGVPTFKYRGRPLIYIGAAKKHLAVYGPLGTIRFQPGDPPPASELERRVRTRMAEIDEALDRPRARKRAGSSQ